VKVWDPRIVRNSQSTPVGIFAGHKDGISHVESKVCTCINSITTYSVHHAFMIIPIVFFSREMTDTWSPTLKIRLSNCGTWGCSVAVLELIAPENLCHASTGTIGGRMLHRSVCIVKKYIYCLCTFVVCLNDKCKQCQVYLYRYFCYIVDRHLQIALLCADNSKFV